MKNDYQIIRSNSLLQYVTKDLMICSRKNVLYKSIDQGSTWEKWLHLPISFLSNLKIVNRLSSRFFRAYVYHVVMENDYLTVFAFGNIYVFTLKDERLKSVIPIVGSRPLVVDQFENQVYYGEYTSNPERRPIRLFRSTEDRNSFEEAMVFESIRHIHGIQKDPISGKLFMTTGDRDEECIIGRFEGNKLVPIVQGSQQARCIRLLFDKEYIYYSTDAPDEPNYIYRLNRKETVPQRLQKIGGPVFYGFQSAGLLFYATVCEPSKINNQKYVELWVSSTGIDWKCILTLKKDYFHMKLFQYGQIIFPSGAGDDESLWFTPFATENDQKIIRIPLEKIRKKLEN